MEPLAPPPQIWAIHGQLQTAEVWQPFTHSFGDWICEDLRKKYWNSVDEWIEDIGHRIEQTPRDPAQKRVLIGYSMGGRLAMMLMIKHPHLFQQAIIISADPGIDIDRHRQAQAEKDNAWSIAFRQQSWQETLKEWERQPVFSGLTNGLAYTVPGMATEEDKHHIANWFDVFSKAKQHNLCSPLKNLCVPMTYLYGERDKKYGGIATQLGQQCPNIRCISIPNAGHRIPWENPDTFISILINELGLNP